MLGGIVAFLVVEKIVRILKGGEHGHSHESLKVKDKDSKKSISDKKDKSGKTEKNQTKGNVEGYLICVIISTML